MLHFLSVPSPPPPVAPLTPDELSETTYGKFLMKSLCTLDCHMIGSLQKTQVGRVGIGTHVKGLRGGDMVK